MEEFVFVEPQRSLGWTPEARELEYQRQYEDWLRQKEEERRAESEAGSNI